MVAEYKGDDILPPDPFLDNLSAVLRRRFGDDPAAIPNNAPLGLFRDEGLLSGLVFGYNSDTEAAISAAKARLSNGNNGHSGNGNGISKDHEKSEVNFRLSLEEVVYLCSQLSRLPTKSVVLENALGFLLGKREEERRLDAYISQVSLSDKEKEELRKKMRMFVEADSVSRQDIYGQQNIEELPEAVVILHLVSNEYDADRQLGSII